LNLVKLASIGKALQEVSGRHRLEMFLGLFQVLRMQVVSGIDLCINNAIV